MPETVYQSIRSLRQLHQLAAIFRCHFQEIYWASEIFYLYLFYNYEDHRTLDN